MRHHAVLAIVALAVAAACDRSSAPHVEATGSDPTEAADSMRSGAEATVDAATSGWSEADGIVYHEEHAVDLTGDGADERVIARAEGPAWDSLQVSVTIEGVRGDTLWHEAWPSLLYFKYDPVAGKADSTVSRIVRDRVEQLLASDRFTMDGGLPSALSRGRNPDSHIREAVRYHLAELDYRLSADLSPADPTPASGWERIDPATVPALRVDAVMSDAKQHPSFTYYAGGEATYAIAWSERENGFVRIYSCC